MTLDMNPEIRAQWCAALRSGEYPQGRGGLHTVDEDDREGYCCLGVLCDLAVAAGVISPPHRGPLWTFDGSPDYLPKRVEEWAGLQSCNPAVSHDGHLDRLANLNDDGVSFAEIADLIDGGSGTAS
jgi:hypothetical protein